MHVLEVIGNGRPVELSGFVFAQFGLGAPARPHLRYGQNAYWK